MTCDDLFPGFPKQRGIHLPFYVVTVLHQVDAGAGIHQRVEQHALLHGRERINRLDVLEPAARRAFGRSLLDPVRLHAYPISFKRFSISWSLNSTSTIRSACFSSGNGGMASTAPITATAAADAMVG